MHYTSCILTAIHSHILYICLHLLVVPLMAQVDIYTGQQSMVNSLWLCLRWNLRFKKKKIVCESVTLPPRSSMSLDLIADKKVFNGTKHDTYP